MNEYLIRHDFELMNNYIDNLIFRKNPNVSYEEIGQEVINTYKAITVLRYLSNKYDTRSKEVIIKKGDIVEEYDSIMVKIENGIKGEPYKLRSYKCNGEKFGITRHRGLNNPYLIKIKK